MSSSIRSRSACRSRIGQDFSAFFASLFLCVAVATFAFSLEADAASVNSASRVRSMARHARLLSRQVLAEVVSSSVSRTRVPSPVALSKFLTSLVSSTSLREVIGVEDGNSLIVPLLGVLRLPEDTVSYVNDTLEVNVNLKGTDLKLIVDLGDESNFRIAIALPSSLSEESVSSSLGVELSSGNNGFLSRLLQFFSLGGAELVVEVSCPAKTLIQEGFRGDCSPGFSIEGVGIIDKDVGDLPSLGRIAYRASLSRKDGFHISVDAPELHDKKIVLSPGVGSITIASASLQLDIGSKLINPFLDRLVGMVRGSKKVNSTLALSETQAHRSLLHQQVFAEAWSPEVVKGNVSVELKGSFQIELLSYKGSADVALSFDSGDGGISFRISEIQHPNLQVSGVALRLTEIGFESARKFFDIKGELDLFKIPLSFSASIENATQSYIIKAFVGLENKHAEVDFDGVAEYEMPGVLKKLRLSELYGELDLTPDKIDLSATMKGSVLERADFSLTLEFSKEKGKRPSFSLEFNPSMRKPLPLFEVLPALSNVPVLNGIQFESLSISPLRMNSNGSLHLDISSVILLYESRISLRGVYDSQNQTYSFSIASMKDSSPIHLVSFIPALSQVPVVKDVKLESFSFSLTKMQGFPRSKIEFSASASVHAFVISIEGAFGGDLEYPWFSFETTRSPDRAVDSKKSGLSFLDGLPVGGFLLDKISGTLENNVVTFGIEGSVAHEVLLFSGQLVVELSNKTGSLNLELKSAETSGASLAEIFSFAKNVPFLEKITFVSASLTIHREEDKEYSGSLSLRSRLWGVPLKFLASLGGGKVSATLATDPGDNDGILLADHIPEVANIDCLSDAKINSFSLSAERNLDSKEFTASLSGKADIFGLNAEFSIEYIKKGFHASFSVSSKEEQGIPVFGRVSWLKDIPVIKDIRFISLHLIAEFPQEKNNRRLVFTSEGSIGPVLLSINANLNNETKSVVFETKPASGRDHLPLSELIPIKGVVAEILGSVKLKEFVVAASLLSEKSRNLPKDSKSRLHLSVRCDLILFGIDFSGSFKYAYGDISFSLVLGKEGETKKLQLSSILPDMKSITDFLGNIEIGHVKMEYEDSTLSFEGVVILFKVELKIVVQIGKDKSIFVSARARHTKDILTLASLIPSLRDNSILKSFGIAEIGLSLNKTKAGTTFSIDGTARLFNVPVSASLLLGIGGRTELKIFTPSGVDIRLSSIIPSVSSIPVLKSITFRDLYVGYEKESSKSDSMFRLGGEIEVVGIALRADLAITSKGFTVAGTADFSRVKTSNSFLKRMMSMCRKFGVMVTSYTHAEPMLDNKIIEKGTVAVFGEISTNDDFNDVSGSVDKLTGSSGSVSGLRFTGMISTDITKCSLSISMPLFSIKLGKKGSASSGLELYFSGLGPSFALKFRLTLTFEKDVITFVAAIAIRPSMLTLSGSMVGRWSEPFGLRNTFIEDFAVQVGINLQTGLPGEFGFMGTVFVHPIHISIAVAVALDGGILVSGSINILSIQAILGVARTLGASIPESVDDKMPKIELHDLRLYIASRRMSIGEFEFNPGFSFAAGIKIYSFAAYVSISAGEDGIEVFGAMSAVKLGPLRIDRLPTVEIPEAVSKLGPAAQNLPKEITSIPEAEKIASMVALAELNKPECSGKGLAKLRCKSLRSSFAQSSLDALYNGPVLAISLSKSSQLIFFTGRVRILGNSISVHVYISKKEVDIRVSITLFGFVKADLEIRGNIARMSGFYFKASIRVSDIRESILNGIRRVFGLGRKEKKRELDEQTEKDVSESRKKADEKGEYEYRRCVLDLPEKRQNDEAALQTCASRVQNSAKIIVASVLLTQVAALNEIEKPSSMIRVYREQLSSTLVEMTATPRSKAAFGFVQAKAKILKWLRKAWNAFKNVFKKVVKFIKKAVDVIKKIAIAVGNAIVAAALAAWRFIGEVIFAAVKAILNAFWLNSVTFEADIGSITSPGRVSLAVDVRLFGKDIDFSLTLDLKQPARLIKEAVTWLWNRIKKHVGW